MMRLLQDRDPILRIETELAASAISPEIARQHFRHVDGDEAVEFIAGSELEQVGGHGKQYATAETGRILRRYEHLRSGGWAF
ncbi:MAG: hypothetical protein HC924_14330, partial [Synechococcaceae cyanobacterium SM2_3_2]|nr:hypothetical protein [Synechococcaceae cyanobacterium SM2_3_2]